MVAVAGAEVTVGWVVAVTVAVAMGGKVADAVGGGIRLGIVVGVHVQVGDGGGSSTAVAVVSTVGAAGDSGRVGMATATAAVDGLQAASSSMANSSVTRAGSVRCLPIKRRIRSFNMV